jgi:hypothetical protein
VTINGRPYGTTPVSINLPAGQYTVVLTKGGTQRTTRTVTVAAGKAAEVFVDMTDM